MLYLDDTETNGNNNETNAKVSDYTDGIPEFNELKLIDTSILAISAPNQLKRDHKHANKMFCKFTQIPKLQVYTHFFDEVLIPACIKIMLLWKCYVKYMPFIFHFLWHSLNSKVLNVVLLLKERHVKL